MMSVQEWEIYELIMISTEIYAVFICLVFRDALLIFLKLRNAFSGPKDEATKTESCFLLKHILLIDMGMY